MVVRIPSSLCAACKGRRSLCGLPKCPLLERQRAMKPTLDIRGNVFGASPPSVVVGESGYPNIHVLIGVPPGKAGNESRIFEDPINWWGTLQLSDILGLRASMIASSTKVNAGEPLKLYEKELSVAASSTQPIDVEVKIAKPPITGVTLDPMDLPHPPLVKAIDIKIDGNPALPRKLEQLIFDDVKADRGVLELAAAGVDVYTIIRAFSMGLMGEKRRRRLVPTRWAITAVDTIIGNDLLRRVRSLPWIPTHELYFTEYLSNRFAVLISPAPFSVAWVEIWHPFTPWGTGREPAIVINKENWRGDYSFLDGGYQAARLSLLKYLESRGRSGSVIIIREVLPEYYVTVGNWHIRESMGHVFQNMVARGDEAITAIKALFRYDVSSILEKLLPKQESIIKYLY
ncbi:MAG: hypothetical protein RXO22_02015 [Thermocladium sp.]|jgi:hypothetical protein